MEELDRKHENGMTIIAILTMLHLLILLAACSTKRVVTKYDYIHDTLVVYHNDTTIIEKNVTDTVVKTKTVYVSDTVYRDQGKIIILNEAGDTINQHSWDNIKQHTKEKEDATHNQSHSDQSSYQNIKNDSIKASQDTQQKEEKQVTKHTSSKFEILVLVIFTILIFCLFWRAK